MRVDGASDLHREADVAQAEYFRKLIGALRLESETELAGHYLRLRRVAALGQKTRANELRRLIRVMEAEARTLDRMGDALQERFGSLYN